VGCGLGVFTFQGWQAKIKLRKNQRPPNYLLVFFFVFFVVQFWMVQDFSYSDLASCIMYLAACVISLRSLPARESSRLFYLGRLCLPR
jgi:hypothetical protein